MTTCLISLNIECGNENDMANAHMEITIRVILHGENERFETRLVMVHQRCIAITVMVNVDT